MSNHGNYTNGCFVLIAVELPDFIKMFSLCRCQLFWLLRIETARRQSIHIDVQHLKVCIQEMPDFVSIQSYQAVGS